MNITLHVLVLTPTVRTAESDAQLIADALAFHDGGYVIRPEAQRTDSWRIVDADDPSDAPYLLRGVGFRPLDYDPEVPDWNDLDVDELPFAVVTCDGRWIEEPESDVPEVLAEWRRHVNSLLFDHARQASGEPTLFVVRAHVPTPAYAVKALAQCGVRLLDS
jgi:hypothetical protein